MIKVTLTKIHKNGDKEYVIPKTSSDMVLLGNNKTLKDKLIDFYNVIQEINDIDLERLSELNTTLYNILHNSNVENSPNTINQNINELISFVDNVSQGIYNSGTNIPEGQLYLNDYVTLINEIREPLVHGMIQDRTQITRVEIPPEVSSISNYAFMNCDELESIVIPENVTTIGKSAFRSCSKLSNVVLHDNITSIGSYAFISCTNLKHIELPANLTYTSESCFESTGLEEITFPEGFKSVGYGSFWYCRSLKTINFPESLNYIGQWAFDGCDSLIEITIPNNVTSIGDVAFCSLDNLEKVNIDIENSKLSSIGYQAFSSSNKLKKFLFPKSISYINGQCFSGSGLEEIIFPDTDHDISIRGLAFAYCINLKKIYLSANCHFFEDYYNYTYNMFRNCTNLEDVTLGNGFDSDHLDLSMSNKYPKEMIVGWLNALRDRTGITSYNNIPYCLTIGEENLNKLTDEEIAIATNKNWTLA
jgi:hypothetical protein